MSSAIIADLEFSAECLINERRDELRDDSELSPAINDNAEHP
jgi:hypothetical protein